MELCSDGHETIAYNEYNCPMCELQGTIEEREYEIARLEAEINDRNDQITEMQTELEDLRRIAG